MEREEEGDYNLNLPLLCLKRREEMTNCISGVVIEPLSHHIWAPSS